MTNNGKFKIAIEEREFSWQVHRVFILTDPYYKESWMHRTLAEAIATMDFMINYHRNDPDPRNINHKED